MSKGLGWLVINDGAIHTPTEVSPVLLIAQSR